MNHLKLFIITGISRGLGEQLVNLLTRSNQTVIAISRTFTSEQTTFATLHPELLTLIQYDLANITSFRELTLQLDYKINDNEIEIVFINNAGVIHPIQKVGNFMGGADVERHVNVNYLTPVLLIDYLLSKHAGITKIINISSGAAEARIEGWSLYCSSKKAMKVFLDVVQEENLYLTVEHIDPGVMDTKMQESIRESTIERLPSVNYFKELENNNKLLPPKAIAKRILKGYLTK